MIYKVLVKKEIIMKKIVFICPYFGKLPDEQMVLWLNSCKYNPNIDWVIITDDHTTYNLPSNVSIKYYKFEDLKIFVQTKFDFKISLEKPYKLCDFKPVYGYIFQEIVEGYDYWGHCDMTDCIFGDLNIFLTDENMSGYDKILFLGHMTLYRNTAEVNNRFRIRTESNVALEDILGSEENKAFDEINEYSINQIYVENKFPLKRMDEMYADVSCKKYAFYVGQYNTNFEKKRDKYIPTIFEWSNGKLYKCYLENGQINKKEIGYVHYQKRRMKCCINNLNNISHFYIVPFGFIEGDAILDVDFLKKYSRNKLIYPPFFKLKYRALKYRCKKFLKRIK